MFHNMATGWDVQRAEGSPVMIHVPVAVLIVIVVVVVRPYARLILDFAFRTSIHTVPDLHEPPTDPRTAAPYRSAIRYERHRH